MLKTNECLEILKRNTPDNLGVLDNEWLVNFPQFLVLSCRTEIDISVDKQELEDKTDAEVKELIKKRAVSVLSDLISTLERRSKNDRTTTRQSVS